MSTDPPARAPHRARVVFMGTPDFAVPSLDALVAAGHEVICVYTQPARPAGVVAAFLITTSWHGRRPL